MLFNLAGLYWRINGNNFHGIECLRRAIHFAPPEYRDIPLLNLANILYKWGRVDDAVTVMRDAVLVNHLEVIIIIIISLFPHDYCTYKLVFISLVLHVKKEKAEV